MQNILIFDSSTKLDFIVLLKNDRMYSRLERSHAHTNTLLTGIKKILDDGNVRLSEMDLILSGRGPGSFTGIRIALATARGLSQATGKSLAVISSLELYFLAFAPLSGNECLWLPFMDARKDRIYSSGFSSQGEWIIKEGDYFPQELWEITNNWKKKEKNRQIRLFSPDPSWHENNDKKKPFLPFNKEEIIQLEFNKELFRDRIQKKVLYIAQNQGLGDYNIGLPIYLRKSDAEKLLPLQKVTLDLDISDLTTN